MGRLAGEDGIEASGQADGGRRRRRLLDGGGGGNRGSGGRRGGGSGGSSGGGGSGGGGRGWWGGPAGGTGGGPPGLGGVLPGLGILPRPILPLPPATGIPGLDALRLRLLEALPGGDPGIDGGAPLRIGEVAAALFLLIGEELDALLGDDLDLAAHGVPGVRVALLLNELGGDVLPPLAQLVALTKCISMAVADLKEGDLLLGGQSFAVVPLVVRILETLEQTDDGDAGSLEVSTRGRTVARMR